jgi:hypothetical protein
MTPPSREPDPDDRDAPETRPRSSAGELLHVLRVTRKWWLLPLIIVLVLLGLAFLITSTGAGPLIYAIF